MKLPLHSCVLLHVAEAAEDRNETGEDPLLESGNNENVQC